MLSRIRNSKAERSEVKRLFGELAQMEPVDVDLKMFSDDEAGHLRGFLTRLLDHINAHSE